MEEPKCYACELLSELYNQTKKTSRDYYIMTELFVLLHDGKDYCSGGKQPESELGKEIDRRRAKFEMAEVV